VVIQINGCTGEGGRWNTWVKWWTKGENICLRRVIPHVFICSLHCACLILTTSIHT
jgi:hypothetical protein